MSRMNTDQGPITRRRSYWASGVGSDIDLGWTNAPGDPDLPREIRVHATGDLNVTYLDGTTEVIPGIPAGAIFRDCMWAKILATSSTASKITVGW